MPLNLRKRARIEPIKTTDELQSVAIETAALMGELKKNNVTRDERIAAVRTEFDVAAEDLGKKIDGNVKRLAAHARAHRADLFGDKKTVVVAGHELIFRKSPGKVAYLPGVKAGDALDNVLGLQDDADVERYTTVRASLSKEAITKAWKDSESARELLRSVGIEVIEPEEFKFQPSAETSEAVSGGKEDA